MSVRLFLSNCHFVLFCVSLLSLATVPIKIVSLSISRSNQIWKILPSDGMNFRNDCRRAYFLLIFKAFGHRFREASQDREVPVGDLGDDATLADSNIVTVAVHSQLAFRL